MKTFAKSCFVLTIIAAMVGCKGLPSMGLSSNILKPPAHLAGTRPTSTVAAEPTVEPAGFASTATKVTTQAVVERDATYAAMYNASYDAAYDAAYHIAYAQQLQQYEQQQAQQVKQAQHIQQQVQQQTQPVAQPSVSPWDNPQQRQQAMPPANHFSANNVVIRGQAPRNGAGAPRGKDEYIVSGGDRNGAVRVHHDWTVSHLSPEDTVAHFDTVNGDVVVVPSNQLSIYAPRFRAVRKVEGVQQDVQRTWAASNDGRIAPAIGGRQERLGFVEQETQSLYARQHDGIDAAQGSFVAGGTQGNLSTTGDQNVVSVMSYGSLLRRHHISGEQRGAIARGTMNVAAWEGVDGVRVRINQLAALSTSKTDGTAQVFRIEQGEGESVLRLLQTASTNAAHPGEVVEFTVRFDNLGSRPIGNVTLLQSLTTRLEFVPDSAETSIAAGFIVEPNDAGSFTLRWEITDPLLPMEFGVVRFKCRVR